MATLFQRSNGYFTSLPQSTSAVQTLSRHTRFLALLLATVWTTGFGQPTLHLQPNQDVYNPAHYAQILEDSEKNLEFHRVASEEYSSKFTSSGHEVLSFGYTTSAMWIKVLMINECSEDAKLVLEIAYPLLETVDCFLVDATGKLTASGRSGTATFSEKAVSDRNHSFRFSLKPAEEVGILIRVESSGAVVLPISLWTESAFAQKINNEYLILGLYYGVLVVLIFYNLILFASFRDVMYLYYSILVAGYGVTQFNFDGLLSLYVLRGHPWWIQRVFPIAFAINNVVVQILTQRLLGTAMSVPSYDKLMNISKIVGSFWLIAVLFLPARLSYPISSILTALTVVIIIPPALIRWRQGYQPAKSFTLAIVALSVAVFIRMFRNLGVLADASVTIHTVHFGTLLDAVFLSLALGDRVNLRKIEQEVEKVKLRDRLARDLHDDLASTLGSISLFAASLKTRLKKPHRETGQLIDRIESLSLEAVDSIGDIVWSVSPEKDTLNNLLIHMRDLVSQACTANKIQYDVQIRTSGDDVWVSPDVRRNVYLIFKEALNNIVKHSSGTSVTVRAGMTGNLLEMNIEDNGRGFRYDGEMDRGHGLRNMEKRAKEIQGQLKIESSQGKGTCITLTKRMT